LLACDYGDGRSDPGSAERSATELKNVYGDGRSDPGSAERSATELKNVIVHCYKSQKEAGK